MAHPDSPSKVGLPLRTVGIFALLAAAFGLAAGAYLTYTYLQAVG